MSLIYFSVAARGDLEAIWHYSMIRWSAERADEYNRALHDKLRMALSDPLSGKRVEIRPQLRQLPSGSHHIYYRPVADGIEVIRILHQSMDVRHHL